MLSPPFNFWPTCGFKQLRRHANGGLVPTADYIALLLTRPEMALVPESCKAEVRLHKALKAAPLKAVLPTELARIQDADARHNYQVFLDFRDGLIASGTLEAYYRSLFAQTTIHIPPVFIDLLVQTILRNVLDDCTDAQEVRAAELLFRPQRIAIQDGQVLAAEAWVSWAVFYWRARPACAPPTSRCCRRITQSAIGQPPSATRFYSTSHTRSPRS
jgi:hypothetical protein